MFTSIMYGFINEVTRQPGAVRLPVQGEKRASRAPARARHRMRPARPLGGQYQVLAETFKRAAGFN